MRQVCQGLQDFQNMLLVQFLPTTSTEGLRGFLTPRTVRRVIWCQLLLVLTRFVRRTESIRHFHKPSLKVPFVAGFDCGNFTPPWRPKERY